ncbi:hypothetical protein ACHQM5_013472 [Ranunculus cassubicifolius]
MSYPKVLEPEKSKGDDGEEAKNGFFACYLLCSVCPRFKGHTYIGFTVNPRRRIRQHNGQIKAGARTTKPMRPWEMILCIYGFPSKISALQFEWAWQHPPLAVAAENAAKGLEGVYGIADRVMLAYTMLTNPPWQGLNLTVNFLSTKYINYSAGCPSLPNHMKVQFCPMDELPCYTGGLFYGEMDDLDSNDENDENRFDTKNLEGRANKLENNQDESPFVTSEKNLEESVVTSGKDNECAFPHINSPLGTFLPSTNLNSMHEEPLSRKGEDSRVHFSIVDTPLKMPCPNNNNFMQTLESFQDSTPGVILLSPDLNSIQSKDHFIQRVEDYQMAEYSSAPLCIVDTPVKTPCSNNSNLVSTVETIEDKTPCITLLSPEPNSIRSKDHSIPREEMSRRGEDSSSPLSVLDTPEKTPCITLLSPHPNSTQSKDHSIPREEKPRRGEDSNSPLSVLDTPVKTSCITLLSPEPNSTQSKDHSILGKEEYTMQFSIVGTPVKTPSSNSLYLVNMLERVQDSDQDGFVQQSNYLEVSSPRRCRKTPLFADTSQSPSSKGNLSYSKVEVIDIFSPSSNSIMHSFRSKKRRNNWVSQGIIDLTKSPNF